MQYRLILMFLAFFQAFQAVSKEIDWWMMGPGYGCVWVKTPRAGIELDPNFESFKNFRTQTVPHGREWVIFVDAERATGEPLRWLFADSRKSCKEMQVIYETLP